MDEALKRKFPDAQEFTLRSKGEKPPATDFKSLIYVDFVLKVDEFGLSSDSFTNETLIGLDNALVQRRAATLLKLNMAFYKLFKLVNHKFRLDAETNHGKHFVLREKVMPTLRFKLIKEQM